jgi:hypothetical protein
LGKVTVLAFQTELEEYKHQKKEKSYRMRSLHLQSMGKVTALAFREAAAAAAAGRGEGAQGGAAPWGS